MANNMRETVELNPMERRIAMMHVANASLGVIAQVLEMNTETVDNILKRPRVARFMLLLHALVSDGLKEGVEDLNKAFKEKASRAFELEAQAMEDLNSLGEDSELKASTRIRAKTAVVFTAKDILDRAGHRAPQKVYNYGAGQIPPEAAEALAEAAKELVALRRSDQAIDVTPRVEPQELTHSNGTDPDA